MNNDDDDKTAELKTIVLAYICSKRSELVNQKLVSSSIITLNCKLLVLFPNKMVSTPRRHCDPAELYGCLTQFHKLAIVG